MLPSAGSGQNLLDILRTLDMSEYVLGSTKPSLDHLERKESDKIDRSRSIAPGLKLDPVASEKCPLLRHPQVVASRAPATDLPSKTLEALVGRVFQGMKDNCLIDSLIPLKDTHCSHRTPFARSSNLRFHFKWDLKLLMWL